MVFHCVCRTDILLEGIAYGLCSAPVAVVTGVSDFQNDDGCAFPTAASHLRRRHAGGIRQIAHFGEVMSVPLPAAAGRSG